MWDIHLTSINNRLIYEGFCPNGHRILCEAMIIGGFASFKDLRCLICNESFGEVRLDGVMAG